VIQGVCAGFAAKCVRFDNATILRVAYTDVPLSTYCTRMSS